ncbi:X2-like carbohydrate binding domain-containing protein [Cohnella fermenti]|uniref:SLH domain-containing protein n=1 Tax=Cohnella fermenti TaxID=2565925 RepID=A0A4S4BRW3_9BACL|nr:X2-like carbohydrate binding domain-containing protein [Cohnella fermenti]THF77584.1 hypothetical protein E6C55_16340 [Cohnella fermenti]
MNQHKRIRRVVAALLSVAIVLGWVPAMETASASTIELTTGSTTVTVTKIAAGQNNSIALKSDGTILAWGKNINDWAKPPEGLTGVVDIYAKDTTFLARKSNGTIVAWGSNEVGEATIPSGLTNVISMASAGRHTLVVSSALTGINTGKVYGWGLNGNGQVTVPSAVATGGVTKVAAGTYYSMALTSLGKIVDWGSNGAGATSIPADLTNVVDIDAGFYYALALKSDGTVVAWGKEYNDNDILDVSGLTNVKAISANSTYALALKNDGTVVGWGYSAYGAATPPAGLTDVVAIAAGVNHALALKSDGTVVGWGSDLSGNSLVPGENVLSGLTVTGAGTVAAPSPAFSSSTTAYQYNIDPGTTSVNVNAVLADTAYSALYINDRLQTSGSAVNVSVPTAGAAIKVKVAPYMKPQAAKTYTLTILRDRVAPTVTLSPNGSTTAVKTISTSVQVTDATSGVDTLEYAWSQSSSTPASGWAAFSLVASTNSKQFTYTGVDGNWYLHIRAKDYAGNETNATSASFLIDATAPELTVTMKNADDSTYSNDTWTNQDVTITAAAPDAHSTSVTLKYTLDGGKTWLDYNASIPLNSDGIYTIGLQASDDAGNTAIVNRTVKIAKNTLKMTLTLTNNSAAAPYTSGDWVNAGVRAEATAETTTGNTITYTYSQKIGDIEVVTNETYNPGTTLINFINNGMNSGNFTVTDGVNTMSVPYAINIDKLSPTVTFSPNGSATAARSASVAVTVSDGDGSGLDESTLEYVWTQDTATPTDGWLPLNNDSTLTQAGVDGTWYLQVRGQDRVGNKLCKVGDDYCIDHSGTVASVVSSAFVLSNDALDSSLSPATATFDLNPSAQADVMTEMTLNGNTLESIINGGTPLVKDEDYTVGGNSVTILKSYLAAQSEGVTELTFTFSGGADQKLKITIVDSTEENSEISPDIASFDNNTIKQADVVTELTLNGNTLESISNGMAELELGTDYTKSGNTVTILKSYLDDLDLGTATLKFTFSKGDVQSLILTISDTTPSISPVTGSFDKKPSEQADVETTMTLRGTTLTSISNDGDELVKDTDYTVVVNAGDVADEDYTETYKVTILSSYLAEQSTGTTSLTFMFGTGNELTLNIDISDSRTKLSTPAIEIDYETEMLKGFATGASDSYTIDGDSVTPDGSGQLALVEADLGQTLNIVKAGDGTTTVDSDAQELPVPVRPATPTAAGVNPTTIGGVGKITGVTDDMEYKSSTGTWTDVAGTEITSLAAGTYQVRIKATATSFKSEEQTITITAYTAGMEATPVIEIDYATEELTGFEDGGSYTIDGVPVTPVGGKLDVASYLGRTLAIVKKGNETTTTDSAAQDLVVPARPATPTATGVNPTTIGGTGSIAGVTEDMEYKSSTGTWTDVTGTEIDSLAAGAYQVRVQATATSFKSEEQTITITAYTAGMEATPAIEIDFANEELTGFEDGGGSYTIDGSPVSPVGGKLDVASYLGRTLAIVKKGNETTTTDSATQDLVVPARPATPTATGVNPTTIGGVGKITGVTDDMEYKSSIGTWTDVTGTEIDSLAAGAYQVRVKATATSFKSEEQTITLTDPAPVTNYTVTVNDGGDGASGSGDYASGDTVSIQAGTRSGYSFQGWTSTDGVTFLDASSVTTAFAMIAQNVTVTANWQMNSGSSGGGGGGSSPVTPATPTITLDKQPSQPTIASVNLIATVDKDGIASATITESQVKAMIEAAQNEARNKGNTADGIGIAFHVLFGAEAVGFSVKVEDGVLALLEQEGVKLFAASTVLVNFSFDQAAILAMVGQAIGDVAIAAHPVTELSDAAKALIGSRPVYDLTVSYEKNGKSEYVTDFGKGTVALGIAYKAASAEKTDNLFAVYVNKAGKPQQLTDSRYDNDEVTFSRNSLSTYGVGYRAPAPIFSDTTMHWAKDDIAFVVSLGLIAGTSGTTFSPNTAITRGDFLMALGKLSGADVSGYTQSSFSDVSGTSAAMPYIEWAVQNNIVQGVGNNLFSPDSSITREQMAVMMARFAQATGHALPVNKQAVTFADGARISAWAREAVKAIQQSGIVQGKDNNRYDPAGNATRAEASTILRRFVEFVID